MKAFARRARPLSLLALAFALSGPASAAPDARPVAPSQAVAMPPMPPLPHVGEQVMAHAQSGIALDGFDPVAYFDKGRPTAGSSRHEAAARGSVWRFASAANRAAFLADPEAYWPAFGGHDPIGVAQGNAVEASAEHFLIVGGRLYLFRSKANRERFSRDHAALETAVSRWPEVENKLAR
jgi:YHS domain-containing protein